MFKIKRLVSKPLALLFILSATASQAYADEVPNLVGKWVGENKTYSEAKGYKNWTKSVEITEQRDRIFKGKFTYFDGTKDFFGVIYPDNTFTWVSKPAKGYNNGKIISAEHITACYVETGDAATVGCADLKRQDK